MSRKPDTFPLLGLKRTFSVESSRRGSDTGNEASRHHGEAGNLPLKYFTFLL